MDKHKIRLQFKSIQVDSSQVKSSVQSTATSVFMLGWRLESAPIDTIASSSIS